MSGNEGELGDEFALMDVQVGAADTTGLERNTLTLGFPPEKTKAGALGHLP